MTVTAFPIIAIGASAGGIEALCSLFKRLPDQLDSAIVIITHLARNHDSMLPEILARQTRMPVKAVSHGQAVEAGHVVIIPPDAILTIADAKFELGPRSMERNIIDIFLTALAKDAHERAIAVILSGTGSDGSIGVKAVREAGGFTLAQIADSGTAPAHPEMPDAAIATGFVDCRLSIDGIAERLTRFVADFPARQPLIIESSLGVPPEEIESAKATIFAILKFQVGHDFSGYKDKTFLRRVDRRMQLLRMQKLSDYIDRLKNDSGEVLDLFKDLLIGVTNFFRDEKIFIELAETVFPVLLGGDGVRVWVPACATGEEAYSLAILLREAADALKISPRIQIFATDIDKHALAVARVGRYPPRLLEAMSPERLARFFVSDGENYVICKQIRDLCLFSCHSLIRDPPFSRIDLISCRNLLIYLNAELQNQVIPIFHYALRPGGYLFIGASENVSQQSDLFVPVNKKLRIFQRGDSPTGKALLPFITHNLTALGLPTLRPPTVEFSPSATDAEIAVRQLEARMRERYCPPHVIVNRNWDIVYCSARTGKYLEQPTGAPSRNLIANARKDIHAPLRRALHEVLETGHPAFCENIQIKTDGTSHLVDLVVEPMRESIADGMWLVLFCERNSPHALGRVDDLPTFPIDQEQATRDLEHDLAQTRARLQIAIEEYETSGEELKSANEELLSVNEELQSSNEELETSKEELQSVNEELNTVNYELAAKVNELDRTNNDLKNLFDSTNIGTIFLDMQLVIRNFTPAATEIFNLIPSDRGRRLSDIVGAIDYPTLTNDIAIALRTAKVVERNIRRLDAAAYYIMRVQPYLADGERLDGVVITFVDVTKRHQMEAQIAENEARFRMALANSAVSLFEQDRDLRYTWAYNANDGDRRLGRTDADLFEAESAAVLTTIKRTVLETGTTIRQEAAIVVPGKPADFVDLTVEPRRDASGQITGVISAATDITGRHLTHEALKAAKAAADTANAAKTYFMASVSHDLRQPLTALRLLTYLGAKKAPAQSEVWNRIEEALGQTESLLSSLMEYSALETGNALVKREVFRLDAMVRSIIEGLAEYATSRDLLLVFRSPPCWTDSDPLLLHRIVLNLVTNALRYTDRGKVLVGIRRAGHTLRIEVRDTGIGIAADQQAMIFMPFRQICNEERNISKGQGLGLSIVAKTVALLGHRLVLRSRPGRGSMFRVDVPLMNEPLTRPAVDAPIDAIDTDDRVTILVVEDDVLVAESVSAVLTAIGYRIVIAPDVGAALARLPPVLDLIMTDYRLPGTTGVEGVIALRQAAGRAVPAIIMTGDTQPTIRAEALRSGCEIIYKPMSPTRLLDIVSRCLTRKHSDAPCVPRG